MARLPRLTLAGYPHHVIQRGNNRQPIFAREQHYQDLLGLLGDNATRFDVAIHAYVLMGNHFHVLATPADAQGLPLMMQAVGRRYVRHFNDAQGRTGTLWEGRYKSSLIQTDRYLLACMVYIDLNPVRAGLCESPGEYPWSSYRHYVGTRSDSLVTPHALYWGLGNTPFAREAAYAELVQAGVAQQAQQDLTQATLSGWALGEAGFVAELQKHTERRLSACRPGRPFTVNKPQ